MSLLTSVGGRLAAGTGAPSLVYFEHILSETLSYFLDITSSVPSRVCLYSVKAATFPFLIRLLHQHGISGFDASSPTEAAFVSRLIGQRAPIYVTAPAITRAELDVLGPVEPACVHLDSLQSIEGALRHPAPLRLGIRVNPGITYAQQPLHAAGGPRSRLGLPLEELGAALELFRRFGREKVGLHLHTTCESPDFRWHAQGVARVAEALGAVKPDGLEITHLDVGGGFRPPAWDFERDVLVPRLDADSCQELAREIERFLARYRGVLSSDFKVLFEPGDLLVCSAAVLFSRVLEERRDGAGHEHLMLDTNINHFPNVLHYGNTPRVLLPEGPGTGGRDVTLSGNSCLGGDHIAMVHLTDGERPPHVVFDERGSYEYTQYNFFNGRFRPDVYLCESGGGLVSCKADRLEDIIGYWREAVRPFPETYQSFHHFEGIARAERGLHLYHPGLRTVSSFEFDPRAFPAPEGLKDALAAGFGRWASTYGRSLGHTEVRERIASFENRLAGREGLYTADRVACTLGATNAIWLTLEALLGGGLRRLLIPCPTYYQFASTAFQRGIPWEPIHQTRPFQLEDGLQVDASALLPSREELFRAIECAPDLGALALVSPSLPLGCRYAVEDIRALAERARAERWILIVDETLGGLDFHGPEGTDWSWLEPTHPVVRLASISKTFGLPGIRLGYLSATEAASRRPDTGEDVFERMSVLADTAYSAPPAALGPVLHTSLDILEKWRAGERSDPDAARYAENVERLRARARQGSRLLSDWGIPHVMPRAGASLSACLGKLPRCREDAEGFFRALVREHCLFLETGGHFSQNPSWNFTLARLGLARPVEEFEADLVQFCRFYDAWRPAALPRSQA